MNPLVVLLTGPFGGGKSTVALALVRSLQDSDRSAAIIDLDLVYCTARQSDDFLDESTWRIAREGAAALVDTFTANGIDVVVVEGSFHNERECADVLSAIESDVDSRLVALDVSYAEVARRVATDPAPDRVLSRDPEVLRYLHSQFAGALEFLRSAGYVVDANSDSPEQLASVIAERLTT